MRFLTAFRGHPLRARAGLIVLIFVGFSILWVTVTDQLLGWLVRDPARLTRWATYKGGLYIGIVALFLFWLVVSALELTQEEAEHTRAGSEPALGLRSLWFPLTWFATAVLLVFGLGVGVYQRQREQAEQRALSELTDHTHRQVAQIEGWLLERKREALAAAREPLLQAALQQWATASRPADRSRLVLDPRMQALQEAYHDDSVQLVSPAGKVLAASAGRVLAPEVQQAVAQLTPASPFAIAWTLLPGGAPGTAVRVSYCVAIPASPVAPVSPAFPTARAGRALGVLVFQLNLDKLLAPSVKELASYHSTLETLLVCRQGEDLVYLNPTRLAAQPLARMAMARRELVGVQALGAGEGTFQGVDYRGVVSVAVARRLTSLPWVLLTKIDQAELSLPIRQLSMNYGGLSLLFLLLSSVTLFAWRQREIARVRSEHRSMQAENRLLEYRLEFLSQHSNDILLLHEQDGRIRYANDRAVEAYGYSQQALQDLRLQELSAPETLAGLPAQLAELQASGALRFETVHRRKDGSRFPVEVSSRSLVLNDVPCFQSLIRDITERKQAELALRASGERYHRLFDEAVEGIALADLERDAVVDCNQAFLRLTGRERSDVVGASLAQFHTPQELTVVREHIQPVLRGEASAGALATHLLSAAGTEKEVELKVSRIELAGQWLALGFFRDLTEERQRTFERETTVTLLRLLNEPNNTHGLISTLTGFIQEWSGCEAVGIRLREGDDFPYFETRGFPAEFVQLENHLCVRDLNGQLLRDEVGNPLLECMCGNILCGRCNPALPFFTAGGSFWSNGTTDLLASTTDQDRQARTRNRCNGEGYESVALIPIHSGQEVFGLLQLNDHAKNRFTPERIAFLEDMGDQIALALAKRQAQAALEYSERRFRDLSNAAGEFLWETDVHGNFSFISERITDILGYTPAELLGQKPYAFVEAAEAGPIQALAGEARNFRNREVPLRSKAGLSVWASITRVLKFDSTGAAAGYFGTGLDITERKSLEATLRQSQERFRNAFLGAPYPILIHAEDGQVLAVNAAWTETSGYALADIPTLAAWAEQAHPEAQAFVLAHNQALYSISRRVVEGEVPIRTKAGETCLWEFVSAPLEQMSDGRRVIISIARDVTEQRAMEAALKLSEEKYRRLFETMKEGFALHEIITDAAGDPVDYRYLDVNPAFEAMTGLSREHWIGHTVLEVLPQTEAYWIETYGRVALTGAATRIEHYTAALDRWYQVFAYSPALRQFAVLVSDYTDRKQAELALQKSERFLRDAQMVGRVGCYSLDIGTGHWQSSETLDELFGIDAAYPRDVQGWLQLVAAESRGELQEHLENLIRERTRFDYDYRITRQTDGAERWVSGLGALEFDDTGRPCRMIGTIQDITETKTAEAEIRRMNEQLEQRVQERTIQLEAANHELEAFSYSVSHDLRGPLRGIDGFSRALLEDHQDRLDEQGRHYLAHIRVGTQRMGQLIDDLLKLSRINRSELDRMEVDLSRLCGKVLDELASATPDRQVTLVIQPGLSAQADRHLLLVALENLLGNAWKFTSRRTEARIEVGALRSAEGERVFFIRDNGAGFEMAYIDKLFDAFQRLHAASEFEGTGIGLAIVQRIIHRHGGRIWATAELGLGAEFFFTLPEAGLPAHPAHEAALKAPQP